MYKCNKRDLIQLEATLRQQRGKRFQDSSLVACFDRRDSIATQQRSGFATLTMHVIP